jgi:hypothetical protein
MADARCPRCEATPQDGVKFCTQCGYDLRAVPDAGAAPAAKAPPAAKAAPATKGDSGQRVDVRLTVCPACGATNAETRRYCGRCRSDLNDPEGLQAQPTAAGSEDDSGEWVAPEPVIEERATPAVFIVAVTLAGLALGGVLLTILSARGVGLFAGPPEPEASPEPEMLAIGGARASSELPPSGDVTYEAANVLDGDEETAWSEGVSGDGVGEWIELELNGAGEVSRLVIWNGYQKGEQFEDNARVDRVRIELGDRRFDADLLDVRGPQAVDLPQTVRTDRVRLTIMSVHEGRRYADAALSGIELRGPPAEES